MITFIFFGLTILLSLIVSTCLTTKQGPNVDQKKPTVVPLRNQILNWWSTFNSPFLFTGLTCETYLFGARLSGNMLSNVIGYLIVIVFLQPLIYLLEETLDSPYKYLEKRHNGHTSIRVVVALVGNFFEFLLLSLRVWSCVVILHLMFPSLSLWSFTIVFGALSLIGILHDGYKQIALIEVFQILVTILTVLAAILLTLYHHNDKTKTPADLWEIANTYGRRTFIDSKIDIQVPYTIWNQVLSSSLTRASNHALTDPNFKKIKVPATDFKSKLLVLANIPITIVFDMLFVFAGIFAFIFFYKCDPIESGQLRDRNQIGPFWIMKSLSSHLPYVTGLFFSSLICNSLKLHSKGIVTSSNSIMDDVIKPTMLKFKIKSYPSIKCLRIFLLVSNILFANALIFPKNSLMSLFFLAANSINPSIFSIILLSFYLPFMNVFGLMVTFVTTLILSAWFAVARFVFLQFNLNGLPANTFGCKDTFFNSSRINKTEANAFRVSENYFSIHTVSSLWYPLLCFLFTLVFGSLLSLIYQCIRKRLAISKSEKKLRSISDLFNLS